MGFVAMNMEGRMMHACARACKHRQQKPDGLLLSKATYALPWMVTCAFMAVCIDTAAVAAAR